MPVNTSSKKYFLKLGYIVLIFTFSAVIFFVINFIDSHFKIREIKVIGSRSNIFGLKEINNKNLLFITNKEIEKILKEKNPSIKTVTVKKELPSKLIVKLTFYEPIAELIVSEGLYGLSDNGKIVYKSRKANSKLTKINFYQKLNYQSYSQGDSITFKEILDGLFFLKSLANLNIKAESLDINGINMLVFNLENRKLIFSSEKKKELQAFQLEEIVRQFKIEGKQYQEIDLRYDKPVIRF